MLRLDDQLNGFEIFVRRRHTRQLCNERIGPFVEQREIGARHAELIGDHDHRQRAAEGRNEIALAVVDERVDQIGRDLLDLGSQRGHAPRGERLIDEASIAAMHRRISVSIVSTAG